MNKIIIGESEELIFPIFWAGKEKELVYDLILTKPGGNITVLGLLIGKKNYQLDLKINVTHAAKNTKSNILLKGAITDEAKINFEGLIKIEKGAKETNAYLACHFLLLSERAKGRAIPSLEILENDIKAGHATTVGRVDDEQLFYLISRGLNKDIAKKVIVNGFLKNILDKFPEKYVNIPDKDFAIL